MEASKFGLQGGGIAIQSRLTFSLPSDAHEFEVRDS